LQNDTPNQALPWTEVTANIDKMQRAAVQVEANQLSSSKVTSFVFVAGVAIATWQPVPTARLNHIEHKTTLTCELHLSPNQAPGPTAKALLSDLGSLCIAQIGVTEPCAYSVAMHPQLSIQTTPARPTAKAGII
jgi:hypothetical protein